MRRNLLLAVAMMFVWSSALSAAEPVVIKPFNGSCLEGWNFKRGNRINCWTVGKLEADATTFSASLLMGEEKGVMINLVPADWNRSRNNPYRDVDPPRAAAWNRENPSSGVDIYTKERFGDITVKLEFLILRGGNSGVYLMGEYELQIADSYGRGELGPGGMGGIWVTSAPLTNASRPPGTWQTLEIEFFAPRFNADGEKIANGLFRRVLLNGVLIQENVEVERSTGGGLTGREAPTGPLMFQGDHGPVAFRNIEIIVKK